MARTSFVAGRWVVRWRLGWSEGGIVDDVVVVLRSGFGIAVAMGRSSRERGMMSGGC